MRSLENIIESVLSKDAGTSNDDVIMGALNPLMDAWVAQDSETLIKIAKPTAIQCIKKIMSGLEAAGLKDIRNYKHFLETHIDSFKALTAGDGVIQFYERKNQYTEIRVYHMSKGMQRMYYANAKDEGIMVMARQGRQSKPIVPKGDVEYVIPGWIAEEIFKKQDVEE